MTPAEPTDEAVAALAEAVQAWLDNMGREPEGPFIDDIRDAMEEYRNWHLTRNSDAAEVERLLDLLKWAVSTLENMGYSTVSANPQYRAALAATAEESER